MATTGIKNIDRLRQLDPVWRDWALEVFRLLQQMGVRGTVYDVYRSPREQERRYRLGDSKARAGQSPHQYGLAFDFVVNAGERSAAQRELQQVWRSIGAEIIDWDPAHVQVPRWREYVK